MIRTLQIMFIIVYALSIAGLMSFIIVKNGENQVPSTEIKIYRETQQGFLNVEDIRTELQTIHNLDSIKVNSLRIKSLEQQLLKDPYVQSADAYTDIEGHLIVHVHEKDPVLRIFNKKSKGYYVTADGDILPLSNKYSAKVFMVNGYLSIPYQEEFTRVTDTVYKDTKLKDILKLTNTLRKSEFLKSQINQIYINSKMEFELVPEFGSHIIVLGDLSDLDKKLRKLNAFYQQALLEEGLNKYKTINLKFDNQVVCVKK